MQTQILKLLEDRLSLELSTYSNLPFYLGWLYLTLKKRNTIYYNGIYVRYHKIENYIDPSNPENDYLMHSYDNLKYANPNPQLAETEYYTHPFKNPTYVVTHNWVWRKTKVLEDNSNYVYFRHDRLKNLINTICNQYVVETGSIPFKYVVPYLFFNRDREITMITREGATLLKYDLQNESIKEKDQYHKKSKYYKLVSHDKLNHWYMNTLNFLYCNCKIEPLSKVLV